MPFNKIEEVNSNESIKTPHIVSKGASINQKKGSVFGSNYKIVETPLKIVESPTATNHNIVRRGSITSIETPFFKFGTRPLPSSGKLKF